MPKRPAIQQIIDTTLYAVDQYPSPNFFEAFDPHRSFERWAAVPVHTVVDLPEGLESLLLPAGQYAVFTYKGVESQAQAFFQYIYTVWLPTAAYQLADRPHFAKMDARYKGEDPDSEEEFWIPIEPRWG